MVDRRSGGSSEPNRPPVGSTACGLKPLVCMEASARMNLKLFQIQWTKAADSRSEKGSMVVDLY